MKVIRSGFSCARTRIGGQNTLMLQEISNSRIEMEKEKETPQCSAFNLEFEDNETMETEPFELGSKDPAFSLEVPSLNLARAFINLGSNSISSRPGCGLAMLRHDLRLF